MESRTVESKGNVNEWVWEKDRIVDDDRIAAEYCDEVPFYFWIKFYVLYKKKLKKKRIKDGMVILEMYIVSNLSIYILIIVTITFKWFLSSLKLTFLTEVDTYHYNDKNKFMEI